MAYPVTGIHIFLIGAVPAIVQSVCNQVPLYLVPLQTQNRPNDLLSDRPDGTKTFDPASPKKMKQHGLRPVVGIMGNRDLTMLHLLPLIAKHFLKCLITQLSARFLRRYPMLCGIPVHVHIVQKEGNLHIFTQPLHIRRILR